MVHIKNKTHYDEDSKAGEINDNAYWGDLPETYKKKKNIFLDEDLDLLKDY